MRNLIITIIAVILVSLVITGCEDYTSGTRHKKDTYKFVYGKLIHGEPINGVNSIKVSNSVKLPSTIHVFDLFDTLATVQVKEVETGNTVDLEFSFLSGGYVDFTESFIPHAGNTYELSIVTGDDSLWATTTVPDSVYLSIDNSVYKDTPEELTDVEMEFSKIASEYPFNIITQSGENIRLSLYFYCIEEWDDVKYIETDFNDSEKLEKEEEYEDELTGYPRKVEEFFEMKPEMHPDNYYNIRYDFFEDNFVFAGRYYIRVHSIDNNYYRYLYKPDGYKYGGINGGAYGYFGSATGRDFYTKVVDK